MAPENPAAYGDAFADVYDAWYGDTSEVEAMVTALDRLAGSGPVLELGIGTGRLAIPLVQSGMSVHGVDASLAMLEVGATKAGWEDLVVICADMCALPIIGPYGAALVGFNTFCNLTTEPSQHAFVAEVARVLAGDGVFVVDLFVPAADMEPFTDRSSQRPSTDGATITTSTTVIPALQLVRGVHLHSDATGRQSKRHWQIRYVYPDQLDEICRAVGLQLISRWSDWSESAFDATSERHVSVYAKQR